MLVCDPWFCLVVSQDFRRLLKKEEKPLLMMFYAPCKPMLLGPESSSALLVTGSQGCLGPTS